MKKKAIAFMLVAVLAFSLVACGDSEGSSASAQIPSNKPSETGGNGVDDSQEPALESESPSVDEQEQARKDFNSSLGDTSPLFYKSVRNDVTGRWRLLVCYTAENVVDHAVDYYNAYFESDDEVHIIVNLGLNTTTVVNCFSGYLYVDIHEYVDGEEHDAKILGGGMLLDSKIVDKETGELLED